MSVRIPLDLSEISEAVINKLYVMSKCIEVYEGFCTSV